jgi:beta-glucosidase
MVNRFQRKVIESSRFGIPVQAHDECLTGFMTKGATSFPAPLNYGSTWNPDLIEQVATVIRREMRMTGTVQGLAPVADVIRDARWGRVEECIAEDPYLVGCMVTAYVRGLQGDDLRTGVVATLKHFVGYSFSEGGRNFAPAHVGRRELEDVFMLPFEMAIKEGGCRSVMNAYQDVDGQPVTSSVELLTTVLRDRWGFEGVVVSDYYSVSFLEMLHHAAADKAEAAAAALRAGLDIELPNRDCYPALREAIDRGLIDEADLDRSVDRALRQKFELGLFEQPYVDGSLVEFNAADARLLARRVADESIILLKNDGVLPFDASARVAVIGPNADDPAAVFGNYSYQAHVASHFSDADLGIETPTLLDALRRAGVAAEFAQGCEVMSDDRSGFDEAVALAADAALALVVVGDKAGHFRTGTVGEGTDTDDLALPGVQAALCRAVIETGTPTVVVLIGGRPHAIPDLADSAAAIVEAWFPGEEGGAALADVLLGYTNPSGKTTVTFAQSAGVQPYFYNQKRLARGVPEQPAVEPVFPFGHGLSYTTFEYADLVLSSDEVPVDGEFAVRFTVTNTGHRAGTEVAQLYLRDDVGTITRPVRELEGFARLALEAGETTEVMLGVPVDLLAFTGPDYRRIVEPGAITVMVGASSTDIRLTGTLVLTGEVRVVGDDRRMTSSVAVGRSR